MTLLTKNAKRFKQETDEHIKADQVEAGSYKSCFIGCHANYKDNPQFIEYAYGIPLMVTGIAESIFERISYHPDYTEVDFFREFAAVFEDGKDLTRVPWKFLVSELKTLDQTPEVATVVQGLNKLASGTYWASSEAQKAAIACDDCDVWSASYAAEAAQVAAEEFFNTSDFASYAVEFIVRDSKCSNDVVSLRQAQTFLTLIKEA